MSVLEQAIEAPEIVQALRTYGVTQNDVASVVGVTDRAVRNWGTGRIRPDKYDRLAEMRDLVILLSDSLTPRGVDQWLHARNRLLDGARPVDLLHEGRFEEIREAAKGFVDGIYV